jgi:hypothetical protein
MFFALFGESYREQQAIFDNRVRSLSQGKKPKT